MKKLNKKGFTLIELLAVIVVLAIIMLIATNSVLPMIGSARKGAFVTDVQSIIEAADNDFLEAQITNQSLTTKCFTISELISDGYLKSITNVNTEKTSGFAGIVSLDVSDKGVTKYEVHVYDYSTKYSYDVSGADAISGKEAVTETGIATSIPSSTTVSCPTT